VTTTAINPPSLSDGSHKVSFSQSKASVSLDAIRGIAALLVCSDHCRHIFFAEFHELTAHRALLLIPYLITASGHEAVIIFFVLSGFLVGGTIFRSLEQQRWSWKQYLTHRFVRLWLVLIPALCLGVLWDHLGLFLQSHYSGYKGTAMDHLFPSPGFVASTLTFPVFFGNAAFLQKILVPTLGTNGALWSLANEFWYYILFPFALFALRRHYKPFHRVLYAVAFILLACFVGKYIYILYLFPVWLAGTALLFIPRRNFALSARIASTVAYIAIFLGCVSIWQYYPWPSDYILTLSTCAYIWILLSATERSSGGRAEHLARGTARFSYTLYLVHMPFMYLLAGFLIHHTVWTPTVRGFFIALGLMLTVILYAWLIAMATEFHMAPVRQWVELRLDRLRSL
jgi:peptidoglycan/LPS O-acetylase OafA/YrhL